MKYWCKRNQDLILINLLTLGAILISYYFIDLRIEILGAILATGISLSLGVRQYKTENDKIFKELFQEFNHKYDVKFNNKLNQIDALIQSNKEVILGEDDVILMIDYLNLCSEEYLWYTKGRIPDIVWTSWENGMIYFFNLPPINDIIISQNSQKTSYYGLFDKIDKRVRNWK